VARELHKGVRRFSFWAAVGGVAILAQVGVEILADKVPVPGLRRLVAYMHRGPGGTSS
jgi:hypothetical protein